MRSLSTLLALIPAVAVAQMPLGDEFQVNTYTTNDQSVAALGPDGAGGFVAAWASWGSSGTDTASASIQAQRFAIDGSTAGAEFQVNTFTTGLQYDPAIGPDGAGGFVVTWWSEGSPGDDDDWYSVQAQRYAADGAPQGDQFQVNSYTADSQYFPAVGPDGSGGFVVAWTSYGSDGGDTDDFGIRAQRFAADGTPQGGEFQVNSYTSSRQIYPAIGPDGDGGFVVVWQSEGSGGDDTEGWSVQGRRFAADGTPLGDDFQVNTYTPGAQERPDVAADGAGGFVVVWQSEGSGGDDTEGWSVQAQRFGADGQPTGGELQVNAYTTSDQRLPAVHPDGLGGFVVAWQSDGSNGNDTSQESIQARRYATDGSPPGPELQVNAFTSLGQLLPTIGPWGEDRFVIAWTSEANVGDNDPEDVRSQRFFSGLFTDGFESGDTSAWSLSHPPPGIPAPVPRRVTPGNSG